MWKQVEEKLQRTLKANITEEYANVCQEVLNTLNGTIAILETDKTIPPRLALQDAYIQNLKECPTNDGIFHYALATEYETGKRSLLMTAQNVFTDGEKILATDRTIIYGTTQDTADFVVIAYDSPRHFTFDQGNPSNKFPMKLECGFQIHGYVPKQEVERIAGQIDLSLRTGLNDAQEATLYTAADLLKPMLENMLHAYMSVKF